MLVKRTEGNASAPVVKEVIAKMFRMEALEFCGIFFMIQVRSSLLSFDVLISFMVWLCLYL